jgi:hypothetical protein
MKIRLSALLIAFFALPTLAQAVDRTVTGADRTAMAAAVQRAATLQTLGRGATLTSNNEQYQVLPGARAVQSQAQELPQQAITRVAGGNLIETKGAFVVFTAAQQGTASVTQVNGATSYPTVLNARTGGIGILPGTLSVKLKNMANAAAVASDHGLVLVREFAHLQAVFYRVNPGQDVVAAAAALTADPRVTSAEVEVIEHMNVPN